jgi:hypothetical protein
MHSVGFDAGIEYRIVGVHHPGTGNVFEFWFMKLRDITQQ